MRNTNEHHRNMPLMRRLAVKKLVTGSFKFNGLITSGCETKGTYQTFQIKITDTVKVVDFEEGELLWDA